MPALRELLCARPEFACSRAGANQRKHHEHLRQTRLCHFRFLGTRSHLVEPDGDEEVSPASPSTPTGSSTAADAPGATGKPMSRAELEELIKKTASQQHENLNWRESIVDLMKLFKLDSSLGARKELAKELGYTGALDGSAEMNVWLHRQVMTKLAETGGKVPEHLKA